MGFLCTAAGGNASAVALPPTRSAWIKKQFTPGDSIRARRMDRERKSRQGNSIEGVNEGEGEAGGRGAPLLSQYTMT